MAPKHFNFLFFILILSSSTKSQVISWAKSLGSVGVDIPYNIFTDKWNNNYIIGRHGDPMDADPGPEEFNMDMIGSSTAFIAKYNPEFEFIWAYNLYDVFALVTPETFEYAGQDSVGNFYMTGEFTYSINPDFIDHTLPLFGSSFDIWFAKYDPSFHIIWGKVITADYDQNIQCATVDKSGNIYLGGSFEDTVDFDPGPDSFFLANSEIVSTRFIAKYNTDGELIFANKMGGDYSYPLDKFYTDEAKNVYFSSSGNEFDPIDLDLGPGELIDTLCHYFVKYDADGNYLWHNEISDCFAYDDFTVDTVGNIYLIGPAWSDLDYDPGPDTLYIPLPNEPDYRLVKWNASGNFEWAKIISGTGSAYTGKISLDEENNIYLAGYFNNSIDFDPGPGIYEPFAVGTNGFISKYTNSGDFISFLNVGGSYGGTDEHLTSMLTPTGDEMMCIGHFDHENCDFDPTDSMYTLNYYGYDDIFIAKYLQGECKETYLTIDSLQVIDCENATGYAKATLHGTPPFSYSWNTVPPEYSDTVVFNSPGLYSLHAEDSSCAFDRYILISGPLTFDSTDLNITCTTTSFLPGESSHIWLTGFNDGCLAEAGTIEFDMDPDLVFVEAFPPADIYDGMNHYTWNFSDMAYGSGLVTIDIVVHTPTSIGFGDSVNFTGGIFPFDNDIDTSNNVKNFKRFVYASFDPNIKEIYPQGIGTEHIIAANQIMNYTIHFQNTGNYQARDIYILDTLDMNLDMNSFRIITSSHPMITEFLNDSVVKFIFDDIFLADSLSDEPASHGYLSYSLDQKSDLSNATVIQNNAAIFFDYNPPVMTGKIFNTIGELPQTIEEPESRIFLIYPNPVHDKLTVQANIAGPYFLTITDCLGRVIGNYNLSDDSTIDVSRIPNGMYILNIQTSNNFYSYKLIRN